LVGKNGNPKTYPVINYTTITFLPKKKYSLAEINFSLTLEPVCFGIPPPPQKTKE